MVYPVHFSQAMHTKENISDRARRGNVGLSFVENVAQNWMKLLGCVQIAMRINEKCNLPRLNRLRHQCGNRKNRQV